MSTYEGADTPTGMQPVGHAGYLVHHEGHPHPDELNNPLVYGAKPEQSDDLLVYQTWRNDRAQQHFDTGSPLPPSGG